jgi:hypothetical protein
MMHGRKKSDLAIVAGKPTNKAGRPAAELVERKARAEGNAEQQSTHRAQDRDRVSQALERVRQAARLGKKERFTALLHHVDVDLLRLAFLALKRDAAPGVDGVTWQDYEADLERKLVDLRDRVHRGSVPGTPIPAAVHTEAGWQTAPARGRGSRGQDRPEGSARGAQRDLRGRLPRVLVWVPAKAQPARRAGRTRRWDQQHEGELDTGRRHPQLLRFGQPTLPRPFPGASDRRPAHHPPDIKKG